MAFLRLALNRAARQQAKVPLQQLQRSYIPTIQQPRLILNVQNRFLHQYLTNNARSSSTKLNLTQLSSRFSNRSFSSTPPSTKGPISGDYKWWVKPAAAFIAFNFVMQILYGRTSKGDPIAFKHEWWVIDKDPYAIQDFYSGEDLLQVLGVHPVITHFMLGRVVWWDPAEITPEKSLLGRIEEAGHVTVKTLGCEISFAFTEEEGLDQYGAPTVTKFEKLERFIQFVPILFQLGYRNIALDYTIIFGFTHDPDDDLNSVCYHTCIEFNGPWIARPILYLQYTYVGWATEAFMNSVNFGDEDRMDEAHEELAFLLPHIYGNLIDKLLQRKMVEIKQKKMKRDKTDSDLVEISEMEHALVRLKTMKINLDNADEEDEEVERIVRSVSIRKTEVSTDSNAGSGLSRQKSVKLSTARIQGQSSDELSANEDDQNNTQEVIKLVAGPDKDSDAAAIIKQAIKDAKFDPEVHRALQEAVTHGDLQWEGGLARQKSVKR